MGAQVIWTRNMGLMLVPTVYAFSNIRVSALSWRREQRWFGDPGVQNAPGGQPEIRPICESI